VYWLVAKFSCAVVVFAVVVTQRLKTLAAIVAIDVTARYQKPCGMDAIFNWKAWDDAKVQPQIICSFSTAFTAAHLTHFQIMRPIVRAVCITQAMQVPHIVRQTFATVFVVVDNLHLTAAHALRKPDRSLVMHSDIPERIDLISRIVRDARNTFFVIKIL